MRATSIALLVVALAGCSPGRAPSARGGTDADLDAYCAIAETAGLSEWIGDVVTICEDADEHDATSCRAMRVRGRQLDPIALPAGLAPVRVMPAGARLVALLDDGRLVSIAGDDVTELAAWAGDPWIDEHGERVVHVALAEGVTEWELGAPTVIRAIDLASGESTILVDDPEASAPRTIPGSSDVLFVSTRSGLASLWLARSGGALEPLTNDGMTEIGPDAVPVPDRELAFVAGTLVYSSTRDDGSARLWSLDLASREARELGSGRWPRAEGSEVVALQSEGECAARMPVGGAR